MEFIPGSRDPVFPIPSAEEPSSQLCVLGNLVRNHLTILIVGLLKHRSGRVNPEETPQMGRSTDSRLWSVDQ